MIDVRFRPISTWPRARHSGHRVSPSFKVTFNATLDRLEAELKHLKGRDIVVETNHSPNDIRNDGWPRSSATDPRDPGVILSFASIHGPLRLPCDRFQFWRSNLHAIALHLEHLRLASVWGVGQFGEQYKGWLRLEAGAPLATEAGMTVEAAARIIGSRSGISYTSILNDPETQQAAYRSAARNLHPDAGGSSEHWAELQRARAVLEAFRGVAKNRDPS